MAQLLFVVLIIAIALGVYRCNGDEPAPSSTTGDPAPGSQLEQTLQTPQRVEQEARKQVDAINERNRAILNQY